MSDESQANQLHLAIILYHIMIEPGGWAIENMMEKLGVDEPTCERYIRQLKEEFEPAMGGAVEIMRVPGPIGLSRAPYTLLRWVRPDDCENIAFRLAMLHMLRQTLPFAGSDLAGELDAAYAALTALARRAGRRGDVDLRRFIARPVAPRPSNSDIARLRLVIGAISRSEEVLVRACPGQRVDPVQPVVPESLVLEYGQFLVAGRRTGHRALRQFPLRAVEGLAHE